MKSLPSLSLGLFLGFAAVALSGPPKLGYRHYIYDTPPEPPLSDEDAAWAEAIVQTRD